MERPGVEQGWGGVEGRATGQRRREHESREGSQFRAWGPAPPRSQAQLRSFQGLERFGSQAPINSCEPGPFRGLGSCGQSRANGGGGVLQHPSKGSRSAGRSAASPILAARRLGAFSPLPLRPPLRDGVLGWGSSPGANLGHRGYQYALTGKTTLSPSLPSPSFAVTALRKVLGSPRRLLARGVRRPGPSGRGVGEGSLTGRRSATANFGCARLGTQGVCVGGGAPKSRTQSAATEATRAGGLGPGAYAQDRARGLERPGPQEPPGTPRPPPLTPGRASSPPPPGAGTHQPRCCGRGDPRPCSPAQPLPPPSPSYLGPGAGRGLAPPSPARGARAPRFRSAAAAAAAASPPSSSSSSAGLAGSRQISSPSRPARPSRSPPGWARPATGNGAEPAGAGLRRSLRQARGERGAAAAGTARCEPGAGRAGGAAAAPASAPASASAPARARARYRPRQRRDCSTFFLSVIEGFL